MPSLQYTHPRKYGQGSRKCRVCGNKHGLIRKYGINICRRCFRERAVEIGFKKVSCNLAMVLCAALPSVSCH